MNEKKKRKKRKTRALSKERGILPKSVNSGGGRVKRWSQSLLSRMHGPNRRQWAQSEIQKAAFKWKKNLLFYFKARQTLEKMPREVVELSSLGMSKPNQIWF